MRDPSGLKAADVDRILMAAEVAIALPVAASQTRAVLSYDAVTMRDPSGLKAAEVTSSSWPLKVAIALPVAASQTRAVLSTGRGDDARSVGAEGGGSDHVRRGR